MKISAVDQSPIFSNTNADQAIRETKDLAKYCDSLGLNRFWLAEHHGSNSFAGCSPEILIPSLASQTESIRVGSESVRCDSLEPITDTARRRGTNIVSVALVSHEL